MSDLDLLATQQCIEISQEIGWTEKRTIETTYEMKLFNDYLLVKKEKFPVTSIFDISFRKKSQTNDIGFLYLHTNSGVRTYFIKEEPFSLIEAYEKLKLERPELR